MVEQDYDEFVEKMEKLADIFKEDLSENKIDVYWDGLKGYQMITIKYAMRDYSREKEYFPKLATLINYCSKALRDHPPNNLLERPEDDIITEDEKVYRKIYVAYVASGFNTKEKNSHEGFKNFVGSIGYRRSKLSKDISPDYALKLIETFSKEEHWE